MIRLTPKNLSWSKVCTNLVPLQAAFWVRPSYWTGRNLSGVPPPLPVLCQKLPKWRHFYFTFSKAVASTGQKQKEQREKWAIISHLSQFVCSVWTLMYEVWERFLKHMSNSQTCNYSNSDSESAWLVTAQRNNLERYVTYISNFFSSDSGITFALQLIGFTHKSNWQNKRYDPIYLRTVSLRQQQAVTSQVIPCRSWVAQITKTEPADYMHA